MAQVPPQASYPGVYIKEVNAFPQSVTEVETAISVFIGYTEKAIENENSILQIPKQIHSLNEYQNLFGSTAGNAANFCLYESIQLFFNNGGRKCHIISVGDYLAPASFNVLNDALSTSMNVQADLLVIPDAVYLNNANDFYTLQNNMLQHCAGLRTRIAILDTRKTSADINNDIQQYRNGIGNHNLSWGAAYYPWLSLSSAKKIPPSGAIAGIYANVDNSRGVWNAPANISVNGIAGLTNSITQNIQDQMNVHQSGKSINAIRFFTGRGFLVWGSRTLAGNDNEWRYVPVRRFFMMVEESIKNACQSFVFEPNDASTWTKAKGMIENYLTLKWRDGALAGMKPEHAFFVKVGLGETMTAQDILEGRMIVEIGMAAVRPAEFIILRFSIKMKTS